jgi:1-deoxy-D-xylulose-5-phosphate reductoisomerase
VPSVGVRTSDEATLMRGLVGERVEIVVGVRASRSWPPGHTTVNAVVGFAGLPATIGALRSGVRLALANKESLVVAADLVDQVRTGSSSIYPIDSEHCALHQCLLSSTLAGGYRDVRRLLLTASGGPFRGRTKDELAAVTRDEALAARPGRWARRSPLTRRRS